MARREEMTDEQWAVIEPLIPPLPRRPDGRGRPWRENRELLSGILWVLNQGRRMIRPSSAPARHRDDRPRPKMADP